MGWKLGPTSQIQSTIYFCNKVLFEQMHDHLITYCLLTGFMLQWYSYQSQAQLLATRKLVGETKIGRNRKAAFKKLLAIWREDWLVSQNQLYKDSAWPWNFLKEKREVISVNHWGRGLDSLPSPTVHRPVESLWSFFRCISFTQLVCKITEGEPGKKIWSSVNYLFFISTSLT